MSRTLPRLLQVFLPYHKQIVLCRLTFANFLSYLPLVAGCQFQVKGYIFSPRLHRLNQPIPCVRVSRMNMVKILKYLHLLLVIHVHVSLVRIADGRLWVEVLAPA